MGGSGARGLHRVQGGVPGVCKERGVQGVGKGGVLGLPQMPLAGQEWVWLGWGPRAPSRPSGG